jgi:YD repeat-containing protein
MKLWPFGSTVGLAILFCAAPIGFGQLPEKTESDTVRVTMSVNADGSHTVYKFDGAQHKAVATTTGRDGKMREKIHYEMDEAGRFSSGQVFGPDGRLRFKSHYKYDSAGRLQEETQSAENDTLLHRIVYSYDQEGKQTGYSIFDASGKLVNRTTAPTPTASPKSRQKSPR